ncbi:KAP family NTPase [Pseudoalteromonas shioyasakiensis]|uniref:KAP family P-loop NTPase fold protein n=1 Tax=Pseudoalteromonas shioyasakiensis TaxID=1190813 RepID=UPI001EFE4C93|nr:P-loop NTPase fold protein [Pseudoalteromonas shioyasakiensis]MCG9736408.1 KAP family NTPase [Pseudoalteromonas shioyasakiensis]
MSRFNWDSGALFQSENLPPDLLDRAKHARFLTITINNEVNPDRGNDIDSIKSHVLNLNADWGAGKTYFLKRWANSLKQDHPVVYIDTWSTDYLESPLITVLTELLEQLKEQTSEKVSQTAIDKANIVLKKAAPKVASAVMKKFLGFDLSIFTSDSENQTADPKSNDDTKSNDSKKNEINFAAAGEAILNEFYNEHKSHKQNVEALSKSIKDWVKLVKENPVNKICTTTIDYPAYIFIDELDRCKPTYAVEMLEAIKHVFDISGLVFVVATNTKELQHTIKAVYGAGFNAESYLNRFFDSKYFIRTSLSVEMLLTHCETTFLESDYLVDKNVVLFPFVDETKEKLLSFAVSLFNAFEIAPREAIKIINRLKFSVLSLANVKVDISVLLVMITLLSHSKEKYDTFLFEMLNYRYANISHVTRLSEVQTAISKVRINMNNEEQEREIAEESLKLGKDISSYLKSTNSFSFSHYLAAISERVNGPFGTLINTLISNKGKIRGSSEPDYGLMVRILKCFNDVEMNIEKYKDVVELANNLDMA